MRLTSFCSIAHRALLIAGPIGLMAATAAIAPARAEATGAASNHCASYGEGFVAIRGSDACVRLGGHVRVDDTVTHTIPDSGFGQDGVRRAAERTSHVRAGSDPAGVLTLYPR